ncbi:MAG: 3-oxoacyl-[acyl-carrier-protein] synthase 2 [candidate division TM6 bacterium GW2011_GWF2_37_49]|nr:MAG: 3-oxoacyl-[acyl-carrier-protein] synthase 2 [candidate division TM6 bacterium GW2011_GWF2_37_49]
MPKHSVVITGIGIVSPLGNDVDTTWKNLIAGKSGISYLADKFPSLANYDCKVAGFVRNEQSLIDEILTAKEQLHTDRFIHLCLIAAKQAMNDSGLSNSLPEQRDRFGSYIGVGLGGLSQIEKAIKKYDTDGPKRLSPFTIPSLISNEAVGWASIKWNLQGSTAIITNACSSSSNALGLAMREIRDGYADYVLAGGTESCMIPAAIAGFGNMRALSTWQGNPENASRPFDSQRTGFVMAEGAAMLILERKDLAIKRNAKIYAEIVGYGSTTDAYHITAIHPDGTGGIKAIQQALHDAQIEPSQVDYINAHGTGTKMNDAVETKILKHVFGQHVNSNSKRHAYISSTKSMTGHMLGATGAAEAIFCALAIQNQILPPTINLDNADPICDLDYIPNIAIKANVKYAISNSFGFGGNNATLVLKTP